MESSTRQATYYLAYQIHEDCGLPASEAFQCTQNRLLYGVQLQWPKSLNVINNNESLTLPFCVTVYKRVFHLQKETPSDQQLHLAALQGNVDQIQRVLNSGKVHVDCKDKVCKIISAVLCICVYVYLLVLVHHH